MEEPLTDVSGVLFRNCPQGSGKLASIVIFSTAVNDREFTVSK